MNILEIPMWEDLSEKIVIEQIRIFQNEEISNKWNKIDRCIVTSIIETREVHVYTKKIYLSFVGKR